MVTQCQYCKKLLNIPDIYEGKKIKCPACKQPFQAFPEIEKEPVKQTEQPTKPTLQSIACEAQTPKETVRLETPLSEPSKKQERVMIKVQCSGCGKGFKVPAEHGGKEAKCPNCGQTIDIPSQTRETRPCPMCAEDILVSAKKCKHCGEIFDSPTCDNAAVKDDNVINKKNENGTNYWVLGIVLAVIAALLLIVYAVNRPQAMPRLRETDKQLIRNAIYEAEMLRGINSHSRRIQFDAALSALDELGRDRLTESIISMIQSKGGLFSGSCSLNSLTGEGFPYAEYRSFIEEAQLLLSKDYRGVADKLLKKDRNK